MNKKPYAEANARKSNQLGMNFSTAQARLRKMVMFQMAQKLGLDTCFKCGEKIETAEELSIEHKMPWLDNDTSLFWDLDNIAFSHLGCNKSDRPAKGVGEMIRKVGPPGTAWCRGHMEFLPIELFLPKPGTWKGVRDICRECENKEKRAHRSRNNGRKMCKYCLRSEDEIEIVKGRCVCLDCWRERQRKKMQGRRLQA